MGEAGPVPHAPADGRIVSIDAKSRAVSEVASGAPLIVDVERGRGRELFALSQGTFPASVPPAGSPALPDTGALLAAREDGTFAIVAANLNLPTSLEVIGNTAYITTLTGDVWRIADIAAPPFGPAP
jgi:hypothetical protein